MIRNSLRLATASLLLSACASGTGLPTAEEGDAYLTVVGDQNVTLDLGAQRTLEVLYHDSNESPLAGEVEFEIVGEAKGGALSASSSSTDSQGIASLRVEAGQNAASFRIKASAEFAPPAEWTVAVGDGAALPLDPEGTYQIDSQFDIDLPGDVGDVVGEFVEMTDDPYDPGTWMLDRIGAVPGFLRPGLDSAIEDLMVEYAPNFVDDVLLLGDKLGQAARKFGTITELRVGGDGQAAAHSVTHLSFRIDGESYAYSMEDLDRPVVVVEEVPFQLEGDQVKVGAHELPVRYGGFLSLALEEDVIPIVAPGASSVYEFLARLVDCSLLGEALQQETAIGADFWTDACDSTLRDVAADIEAKLLTLDEQAPLLLEISGEARGRDTGGDGAMDEITGGEWLGRVGYDGETSVLREPGQFSGQRIQD